MKVEFYTGSYGHAGEASIMRICADFENKALTAVMRDAQAECPSYLLQHPNGKILYAVRELTEEGGLYTFEISEDGLCLKSTQLTLGKDPCYLSLDESGRFLFVVNYTGSSFSVFQLGEDGIPVGMTEHIVHAGGGPHPIRQEAAHPHCAVHASNLVYVCDLGMDQVVRYQLNVESGKLAPMGAITMPAGSGPRHLCVSRDGNVLYVVGELSSRVYVVKGNEVVQSVSTLPENFNGQSTAAAIKCSRDGKAVFVSNRGDDSIAMFRVLPDGLLERTDVCKTGGETPRDFSVFESYLVAANQDSDSLTVLHFDPKLFRMEQTGMTYPLIRPTMVLKI